MPIGEKALVARSQIDVAAPPETVWDVLANADSYGEWVVGTREVTRADLEWPQVGTALEYELGVDPITVGDRTRVLEADPPRLLVLRAELHRLGAATIRLDLEPVGAGTRVLMEEEPVEGFVDAVHNGLTDAALKKRNDSALDRLRRLAEARV